MPTNELTGVRDDSPPRWSAKDNPHHKEPTPEQRRGGGHTLASLFEPIEDRLSRIEAELERRDELLERLVEALEDGRGELDPAWD